MQLNHICHASDKMFSKDENTTSRGKMQFNPPKNATKGFSTDFGRFELTF